MSPIVPNRVPAKGRNVPNDPDDVLDLNARQQWVMTQAEKGTEVLASMVVKQFGCSQKSAKRGLADLREKRLLRFVGSTRTGDYRRIRLNLRHVDRDRGQFRQVPLPRAEKRRRVRVPQCCPRFETAAVIPTQLDLRPFGESVERLYLCAAGFATVSGGHRSFEPCPLLCSVAQNRTARMARSGLRDERQRRAD